MQNRNGFWNVIGSFTAFVLISFLFESSSFATTLDNSLVVRAGFQPNLTNSYDAPIFNALDPFTGFLDTNFLSIGPFDGGPLGSILDFTLLSEAAAFDQQNSFGFIDSNNNFHSLLAGSARPGEAGQTSHSSSETLTLALNSPLGLFSSVDSNNSDNRPHLIGKKVVKSGQVTISHATLAGGSLTVNLQFGDLLVFGEDLPKTSNPNQVDSDFDYNDLVVSIRQTAIPEPATMVLLGSGLAFIAARRKKLLA